LDCSAACDELLNRDSDNQIEKGVDNNHRKTPEPPVKTWNAVVMELGEVVDDNTPEVCDFSDELRNIIVLLPSDVTVSGGTPRCAILDFLVERVTQGSVKVIEDLGDMVLELGHGQTVGSGQGRVVADSGHPFGDNVLATV